MSETLTVAQAIDDFKVAWTADLDSFSSDECTARFDALIAAVRAEEQQKRDVLQVHLENVTTAYTQDAQVYLQTAAELEAIRQRGGRS